MNEENQETKALAKLDVTSSSLNLALLSGESREEILKQHAQMKLSLEKKAQELGLEAKAVKTDYDSLNNMSMIEVDNGTSFTFERTMKDSRGETRIIIGNSEVAQTGVSGKRKKKGFFSFGR